MEDLEMEFDEPVDDPTADFNALSAENELNEGIGGPTVK